MALKFLELSKLTGMWDGLGREVRILVHDPEDQLGVFTC
jgi:hypothetical protein